MSEAGGPHSNPSFRDRARRYWKYLIGVLVAFGVLGAIGSRVVDSVFHHAEQTIHPENALIVSAREEPVDGSDGFGLAARSPTGLDARLGRADGCTKLLKLGRQAGASNIGFDSVDLVVEGGTGRGVSIVDMRAHVLKRTPALTGALIGCQSAGAMDAIGMGFDLSDSEPPARRILSFYDGRLGKPYFDHGKIIRLTKGEIVPVAVVGYPGDEYVEWEILADVVIDGKTKEIVINDHGSPFRVTAGRTHYQRYYEYLWSANPRRMWMSDKPSPGG